MSNQLPRLSARKIMESLTTETVIHALTGQFILVFDDGSEVVTDHGETIFSFYCWEFHRQYPRLPLLSTHHFATLLGDRVFGHRDLRRLLTIITKDVRNIYRFEPTYDPNRLAELAYEVVNTDYNESQKVIGPYVNFVDALDFHQFLSDPEIYQLKVDTPPDPRAIAETNEKIKQLIMTAPRFADNAIAISCRAQAAKIDQVLQEVGLRGPVTDIDSHPFENAIMHGYADGFLDFRETLEESRSMSKSLMVTQDELQNTEYFSRRLQFQAQQVQRVHHNTDCGSQQYLSVQIGRETLNERTGEVELENNSHAFVGKNFLNEETGKLEVFTLGHWRKYRGKRLKMRYILKCFHQDINGVCSTCLGDMADSVPPGSNLGQISSTSVTRKSSQSVLSTKHLDGTITIRAIHIDPTHNDYIRIGAGGNKYIFNQKIKNKSPVLLIDKDYAKGIIDLGRDVDVRQAPLGFYSRVPQIGIRVVEKTREGPEDHIIDISVADGRNIGSLSYTLLEYIQKYGMIVSGSDIEVSLADWDWNDEFLVLPLRNFNPSDHSRDIADMLESTVMDMTERDKKTPPENFLLELLELVNQRLDVNLAVLEVITYSLMIRSAENNDYQLPKPWTTAGLGVKKMTMLNRSMGVYVAYQEHKEGFTNPGSFVNRNRPTHPMDGMVCPREVFQQYDEMHRYC